MSKFKNVFSIASLSLAIAFTVRAANNAYDAAYYYKNPWGVANPQSRTVGFAPWVFDVYNPSITSLNYNPFFIDTVGNRAKVWAIKVAPGATGYNAAWVGFTGVPAALTGSPSQHYISYVFFTPPGVYSKTEQATEGIDLFALSPTVPSAYDTFGHQVLGIYLTVSPIVKRTGSTFTLVVHNTLNDENGVAYSLSSFPFQGTAEEPEEVIFNYAQLPDGQWTLTLYSFTINKNGGATGLGYAFLSSAQYGPTWNTTTGVDAVRYFTSQGGAHPGGPLAWTGMSVYYPN
jgi:hypothetical protein